MQFQYFYLPISALWMNVRFGVQVCDDNGHLVTREKLCRLVLAEPNRKLRVHPDSHRLFAPQDGDVYFRSVTGTYHNVRKRPTHPDDLPLNLALDCWNNGNSHDEVIRRNEIAFHTPEARPASTSSRIASRT
ncbi:MAG: hypothetical protein IT424_04120 [Pirellulales bacterium]|nr:hypothetical protein [Pirellulales bacterium]